MDEFGVLVESIGFKPHGKSSPMAKSKPKPKSHFPTHNTTSFHDPSSLPINNLDEIFRSNVNTSKNRQSENAFDIFGGPVSSSNQYIGVDLESVFSVGSNGYGDLIGSKQRDSVDDLFGSFGINGSDKKRAGFDDLIPGFGGDSETNDREAKPNGHPSNSSSTGIDDPFSIFESSASDQSTVKKSSVQSNGFGNFVMAGPPKSGSKVAMRPNTVTKPSPRTSSNGSEKADAIFGGNNAGKRNNNAAKPSSTAQNSVFDGFFHEEERKMKISSPPSDFTSLFGDVATSSEKFHEVEGEPAERRRARLKRYMKTNERMAEALAEKNQRDLQTQNEQDEKRRLGDTLDSDIKRWAAGKEGNLRALLSSLHQVLGPESGWRAVSLTDMITSESVRKIYKKATLYVHPDKVQQRGANMHQKYVAEKVFDILKEASNKFSAEELR